MMAAGAPARWARQERRAAGVGRQLLLVALASLLSQAHAPCVDLDEGWMDRLGNRCWEYEGKDWCTTQPFPADVSAGEACCVCGGGIFPEPEPEPEPEPQPEPEPEAEPLPDCVEEPGGPEFKTCTEYLEEGRTCEELRSPLWQDAVPFGCCACGCAAGQGPSYYGFCETCPVNTYSPDGSTAFMLTGRGIYRSLRPDSGCRPCDVCEPGSMHFESQLDGCLCMIEWNAGYPCNPNDIRRGCPAVPCDLGHPQGVGDGGVTGQSWCLTNISASPAHCSQHLGACIGGARCSVTTNTVCVRCTNGTFSTGGPACETCAPPCANGQHEVTSCTLSTDRVCDYCSPEEYGDGVNCFARAVCGNGLRIERPPEPHEDRVCVECAPGKYSSSPGDMACFECPDGFTASDDGGSCEDANECELVPDACVNGGTCFESTTHYPLVDYNTFQCTCVDPYYGEGCRCRTIGDGSRTCCDTCVTADDGVCDDGGPPPEMCLVRSAFCADVPTCMLGTDCEDCGIRDPPVNPCDAEPCGSTGFCAEVTPELPGDVGYKCTCVTGWQGFLCDDDIDECLSVPCLNGGVCTGVEAIRGTGYSCDCAGTGWEGQHCELEPLVDTGTNDTSTPAVPTPNPDTSTGTLCEDLHISCAMLTTAADCFNSMDSDWRLYNCARRCLQCPASVELAFGIDVTAIGGSSSPTRVEFVRNLVYSFAQAAAVEASRVTLTELRGGSVVAILRVSGVARASEPSASVAVLQLQSLYNTGELSFGPDLPILSLSVSGVVPVTDEVEWNREWADVRSELDQQQEPEPEPEPDLALALDTGRVAVNVDDGQAGAAQDPSGLPVGAVGGIVGAVALFALLSRWLQTRSRGGKGAVHPANKLDGFAQNALSENASRTVAMAMFRRIDLDGNGVVDRRELRKLCESEGLGYHGTIMREMDEDRSGEVSIDEFCAWWAKHNPAPESKDTPVAGVPESDTKAHNILEPQQPASRRHLADIDSDEDHGRQETSVDPAIDLQSSTGSKRARPKSASAARATSSRRPKENRTRPQSASVHGRSTHREDGNSSDGRKRGGRQRPQSARPSSSRSRGHSRRHNNNHDHGVDEDEPESDAHASDSESKRNSSASKRRPKSASASSSRRRGRDDAHKAYASRSRPQSASHAERRSSSRGHRNETDAKPNDGTWEGLLDADDGLPADDEDENEAVDDVPPPSRGRSKRPQSAPAKHETGSGEARRGKGVRPSSAHPRDRSINDNEKSGRKSGHRRRGVSSRDQEILRELDSVNAEGEPEENSTAKKTDVADFNPASLDDLPPLDMPDTDSGKAEHVSSRDGRQKRPKSSKPSSSKRTGSSTKSNGRSRRNREASQQAEDDESSLRGKGRRGRQDDNRATVSDERNESSKPRKKRGRSQSRASGASTTRNGLNAKEDSSDDSDGAGGLAGNSLSVHELAEQRHLRSQKSQRAAKKAQREKSSTGSGRPPSAAAVKLQGNRDFLANELGITKHPRRRH